MREIQYDGNIFLLPHNPKENTFSLPKGPKEAAVVTTNGMIKMDGRLVMGAGIAKYCRDNYKGIDLKLGQMVSLYGNQPYVAGQYKDKNRPSTHPYVEVISMPTKHDWRDPASLALIIKSCKGLVEIADFYSYTAIYMPPPGCSCGGLSYWDEVRDKIGMELDDRFIVCLPSKLC